MRSGKKSAKPMLVWTAMDGSQKFRLLVRFLSHCLSHDCVIVIPSLGGKRWLRKASVGFNRLGLVRLIVAPERSDFFYSDQDQVATELSELLAHRGVDAIRHGTVGCDWTGLDEAEREHVYTALQLGLANAIYAGIRSAIGLDALIAAEGAGAVEYFDVGSRGSASEKAWRVSVNLVVPPRQLLDRFAWTGLGAVSQAVQSVILGSSNRIAYVDAAAHLAQGEVEAGKSVYMLFPQNPLRGVNKRYFLQRISQPYAFLQQVRTKVKSRPRFVAVEVAFEPEIFARLGGCAQMARHVTARMLRNRVPKLYSRLAGQYMHIRDNPHFKGVTTVFVSPSRSPIALSLLHLFRSRGARVVEYQPFFWSAHPRYEVRDLDLFVCSDEATMQIVQEKYRALGSDTPVILGPSFAMASFLDRFQTAFAAREAGDAGRYDVGVALQPIGLEQFEEACSRLQAAGMRLLIRAHPVMDRAAVERRFGPFGTIDGGTLEDFLIDSQVTVTGFSNVAVQATACGRPAVCLPQPEGLGLDLSVASPRILICKTMEEMLPLVQSAKSLPFEPPREKAMEQWMKIRRDLEAGVYDRPGRARAGTPTTV